MHRKFNSCQIYDMVPLIMMMFKKVAIQAAKEAGKILLHHFGHLKYISRKKNAGLVTEADKEAEKKIISIIRRYFPTHTFLAEENTYLDEKLISSEFKWVIDPLDGTTNYSRQFPLFCVSIALEYKQEIVLGVIWDPIHQDLFIAEKGKGAVCNGKRIFVSKTSKMKDALFVTGFSYLRGPKLGEEISFLEPFMQSSLGVRRSGSAVWDLCQVAQGHCDGFWERYLKPWDVAAGILLVQEAGGKISRYNGTRATIYDQEIVASNGQIHKFMVKNLTRF